MQNLNCNFKDLLASSHTSYLYICNRRKTSALARKLSKPSPYDKPPYLCCQISVVIGYWRCNRRNHSIEMTKSTFRIHIRIHHQDKSNVERVRTKVKYWSSLEGLRSAVETRVCQVGKYLLILFCARKNYSLHLFIRKKLFVLLSFYF